MKRCNFLLLATIAIGLNARSQGITFFQQNERIGVQIPAVDPLSGLTGPPLQHITYQGVLTGPNGVPMPDSIFVLTIKLYQSPTGGVADWSDQFDLRLSRGSFSIVLGSGSQPLSLLTFNKTYYVEVTVDTGSEGPTYPEVLSPRTELTAAPYALAPWIPGLGDDIYISSGKVGIGTSSPEFQLTLDNDGGILSKGAVGSGISLSSSGPGTRLMWYPRKSAFRAGHVDGSQWNDDHIGLFSIALGDNSEAFEDHTIAIGRSSEAITMGSVAIGNGAIANGEISSFAIGNSAHANGNGSFSIGNGTIAASTDAIAIGTNSLSIGSSSTALGYTTTARGDYSTAMGNTTNAKAYVSTAIGQFNVGGGDQNNWVATDPLFEIGNGSSGSAPNNAMTVLKNGNVGIGTTIPQQPLSVAGAAVIDQSGSNDGVVSANALTFGYSSGEGIASKRTNGGNQFGIDVYTASTARLSITGAGNVGIGKTNPSYKLEVNGDINAIGAIRSNGTALTSDARFKTNVEPLQHALASVLSLRGVSYKWNRGAFPERQFSTELQIGFIAQELERVFPELVSQDALGFKGVDYARITPILVEAIKELASRNDVLKSMNENLEGRLDKLERALNGIISGRTNTIGK